MQTLQLDSLTEMSGLEMSETEGGLVPLIVAAGVVGAGVGVMIVGAAVGYGIYQLVDWATS